MTVPHRQEVVALGEHDGHRNRLRKQFLEHGMDVLRDYEVLELLLFYAVPRKDTNALARRLLKHFGSFAAVLDAPIHELTAVEGIGEHTATLLHMLMPISRRYMLSRTEKRAEIKGAADCIRYVKPLFHGKTEEEAYLICLDGKNKVLQCKSLQEGSENSVSFPTRRIIEIAVSCHACSVILAHNHPSGSPLPSQEDHSTTKALMQTLQSMDIHLLDHVIVSGEEAVSMAGNGYLAD